LSYSGTLTKISAASLNGQAPEEFSAGNKTSSGFFDVIDNSPFTLKLWGTVTGAPASANTWHADHHRSTRTRNLRHAAGRPGTAGRSCSSQSKKSSLIFADLKKPASAGFFACQPGRLFEGIRETE
jgi:hypothetical protein